jgi:hypothetical protein
MPEAGEAGYERRDLSARAIAWFTVGLAILAVLTLLGMGLLMRLFSRGEPPGQALVRPGDTSAAAFDRSAQPDLQVAPLQDLATMHAAEEAQLKNYGWVDRQSGIAAIPIERAMEIVVERGLKVHERERGGTKDPKVAP